MGKLYSSTKLYETAIVASTFRTACAQNSGMKIKSPADTLPSHTTAEPSVTGPDPLPPSLSPLSPLSPPLPPPLPPPLVSSLSPLSSPEKRSKRKPGQS